MVNLCSRFPNLRKSVLSSSKQFWAHIHLWSERCYFLRASGSDSVDIIQSEKHLPCSLKTLFQSLVLNLFLSDVYSKQTKGAAIFNNLKQCSGKIFLYPNGSTFSCVLKPLSKIGLGNQLHSCIKWVVLSLKQPPKKGLICCKMLLGCPAKPGASLQTPGQPSWECTSWALPEQQLYNQPQKGWV